MQIKKVVVKQEQEVAEIEKDELVQNCAVVCEHLVNELYDMDDDDEVKHAKFTVALLATYSALLVDSIFNSDDNDESEEK